MQTEQNFDFMKKFPETVKSPTYFQQVTSYLLNNITAKRLIIGAFVIAASVATIKIPYYGYQLINQSNQKEEQVLTEKMQLIQKITPAEMTATLDYMQKMRAMETQRLTDLFWKIKFLEATKPQYYAANKYVKKMSEINREMNTHYLRRMNELSVGYQLATTGKSTSLGNTYDGTPVMESIIYWKNAAQLGFPVTYNAVDQYVVAWEEDLTDKAEIAKYLESQREIIQKTKVFMTQ